MRSASIMGRAEILECDDFPASPEALRAGVLRSAQDDSEGECIPDAAHRADGDHASSRGVIHSTIVCITAKRIGSFSSS